MIKEFQRTKQTTFCEVFLKNTNIEPGDERIQEDLVVYFCVLLTKVQEIPNALTNLRGHRFNK